MPTLVKRSNTGNGLNVSNASLRNALRNRNASALDSVSPRTLGRIGGAYGLGRRGKAFFIAVMMASSQIASGQVVSRSSAIALANATGQANAGPLRAYMGSNKTNLAFASQASIVDALDTSVANLVKSVKPEDFACSVYNNANWKRAGSARNYLGRNTSAQELAKMDKVCEMRRKQGGDAAQAYAHASGTSIATLTTAGVEQLMSSQLILAQKQLNAHTTSLERAQAALNKVKQNRESNKAEAAANLAAARAKYNANLQAFKNSQTLRKSLRNTRIAIVQGTGKVLSTIPEAAGQVGEFITGGLKDINSYRRLLVGLAFAVCALLAYGFIEMSTAGMIGYSIRKLFDLRRKLKADDFVKPIADLAKSIDESDSTRKPNVRQILNTGASGNGATANRPHQATPPRAAIQVNNYATLYAAAQPQRQTMRANVAARRRAAFSAPRP